MRSRTFPPRQALVRDVSDQDVLEPVLGLARDRRREALEDQLAAFERPHDLGEAVDIGEPRNRAFPEHTAHDRGLLHDSCLVCGEEVEPGEDHGLDVVRDLDLRDLVPAPATFHPPR
jgi:hypothetical protein